MDDRRISRDQIEGFARMLRREELRESTIENYLRHVAALGAWMGDAPVTKERVAAWKESLLEGGRCPGTVNSMLVSANRFLAFLGWGDCQVKALRVQRQLFRENRRELTRGEFDRLIAAARAAGRERLLLLMETICSTGIRVSEVKYITVEALRCGKAEIALKGKIRTILLPARLCRKLLKYCKKRNTVSGEVFLTKNGSSLSRKQIWAEMKSLCGLAGVAPSKVFPHNLRHLFARAFFKACRDVAQLADVLGHSSMETTRIYLISTGTEHARTLEQLRLVS